MIVFIVGIVLSVLFTVLRSYVQKCSVNYWVFVALTFIVGIFATVITNISLRKSILKNDGSVLTGSNSGAMDSHKKLIKYSVIGFLVGVLAASMGIGGGLVQTPLMLSMGVPPFVTRMASSTMITFTAFMSTV
jgi:hypothetical protein